MGYARRIIFGTEVILTQILEGDEANITHEEYQTGHKKRYGGRGIRTIMNDQLSESWTSFSHTKLWSTTNSTWTEEGITWTGTHLVTDTATQIRDDALIHTPPELVYIKNTGQNKCYVSLAGSSPASDFAIVIPPNGAFVSRGLGSGSSFTESMIYVKTDSSEETTIEFVVPIFDNS